MKFNFKERNSSLKQKIVDAATTASNVSEKIKKADHSSGRFIALSAASALVALTAVTALYRIAASQVFGASAPNYAMTYDNVQAPHGVKDGSKLVAVLSASIKDELSRGFGPSGMYLTNTAHWRDDTTGFQTGKLQIIRQVNYTFDAIMARDQVQTVPNADLDAANSNLQIAQNMSLPFIGTTAYYKSAATDQDRYNEQLASGKVTLPKRISDVEAVLATVWRFTGQEEGQITATVNDSHFLTGKDRRTIAENIGAFRSACEVLKAVSVDYKSVIANQNAQDPFRDAVDATCAVANTPMPKPYFFWSSNLDSAKKSLHGDAQRAVAQIQTTYGKMSGGQSPI